jgi:hypothetical protein
MQKAIIATTLFLLQIFILLKGSEIVGVNYNPFLLLIISLSLPVYYFYTLLGKQESDTIKANIVNWKGFTFGCLSILAATGILNSLFKEFADPHSVSDVLLSVETLYDRFVAGVYPYQPLEQYAWHPFPPYLPLYWLPVSISRLLHIDVRWTGVIILALATGIYGIYCWASPNNSAKKILILILPLIALLAYTTWAKADIAVSFEFIIGAYYLLVATGLALRNLPLIILGIICCLLSRFTLIFWLPLFGILLWQNVPYKKVLISFVAICAAVLFIYIIPFYIKDPTAFGKALAYYKGCAVSEWEGMGREHFSWTFTTGIHFAPYFRSILKGTMEQRVSAMQLIQLILMLIIALTGILLYRKLHNKINFYDFCLPMLNLTMLFYFMTAPLVFKYYYFALLMTSAVLCSKIILKSATRLEIDNP